jgi:hypothetical protein
MTRPNRRWPRYTLRTMFVVVALAGVVVSVVGLWRRADSLRERSKQHLLQAAMYQDVVSGLERLPSRNAKQEALLLQFQEKLNDQAELSLKCDEAMWRPWVSVEDDPPAE